MFVILFMLIAFFGITVFFNFTSWHNPDLYAIFGWCSGLAIAIIGVILALKYIFK